MNRNDYVPPSQSPVRMAPIHEKYRAGYSANPYGQVQRQQFHPRATLSSRTRHHVRSPRAYQQQGHPRVARSAYPQNTSDFHLRTPPRYSRSPLRMSRFPYNHYGNNPERHYTPPRQPAGPPQHDLVSPPNTLRIASSGDSFKYPPSHHSGDHNHSRNYPLQSQSRSVRPRTSITATLRQSSRFQRVGDPRLQIYRVQLPWQLLNRLKVIVQGCERFAAGRASGWQTDLFSLTSQDLPLREIPDVYEVAKPIVTYMKKAIAHLYDIRSIRLDRNQPHVKKYSADDGSGHTGVELHYDKSDVTANLSLSDSTSYTGGGTCFPDTKEVVRLEFGEFLLHPGQLVHGGMDIIQGTRYLMVIFANTT